MDRMARGEVFRRLVRLEVDDPVLRDMLVSLGLEPSFENAICLAAVRKAAAGDMTAFRNIREALGDDGISEPDGRPPDLEAMSDAELVRLADALEE